MSNYLLNWYDIVWNAFTKFLFLQINQIKWNSCAIKHVYGQFNDLFTQNLHKIEKRNSDTLTG